MFDILRFSSSTFTWLIKMIIYRMFLCRKRALNLAPFVYRSYRSGVEEQIIDYLEVVVEGGHGGSGSASQIKTCLRGKAQEKRFVPDGARGGRGGNVIIKAVLSKPDLSNINKNKLVGGRGENGRSNNQGGAVGEPLIVPVPVGTRISNLDTNSMVAELEKPNQFIDIAQGGVGGRGSKSLAEGLDRSKECRMSTAGEPGSSMNISIEMRCIANVGLVGFPNAGKSSLLRAISAAKPKVSAYPFTTLKPHIGVMHYGERHRVTVADIPGLIEDAHLDRGLGISFLRHIERCSALMYVVDMSGPNPAHEISVLENEINCYQDGMSDLIIAIVANKIDLLESAASLRALAATYPHIPLIPISAVEGTNLASLRKLLSQFRTEVG